MISAYIIENKFKSLENENSKLKYWVKILTKNEKKHTTKN